jgi:pyruvate/2-oxoacid:ferredoxin oxidoreductase alpha subunit
MSQRDTGWVQLYCGSAQEVLDSVLCAYRVAETAMLPVMVCSEGFILSHTAEVVDVPEQETVDAFIPLMQAPEDWVIDPEKPRTFSALPEGRDYAGFMHHVSEAMDEAQGLVEAVADEFTAHFGRRKVGALDIAGNPDAESALVTIGTIGETALELLEAGDDVLLVRVHAFRPFPARALTEALSRSSYVSIIDRAPAFGSLGPLGADVLGSVGLEHVQAARNYIGGLGGVDVTPDTLRWVLEHTRSSDPPRAFAPVTIPEGV